MKWGNVGIEMNGLQFDPEAHVYTYEGGRRALRDHSLKDDLRVRRSV